MSRLHLKAGPMRDLFAIIYNISKDGVHTYHASTDHMAEWLGISERHVREIIKILIESGYINRVGKSIWKDRKNPSRHEVFEYTTNYEELLRRSYAGDEIRPLPMRRRAKEAPAGDKKEGESSPFLENDKKEGENDVKRGVNVPKKEGESSAHLYKDRDKDRDISLSESARAREAEQREFYKIFFFRNAANPAAETRKFIGWYQSRGWQANDGAKYDTMSKRVGLAYAWDCKGGDRIPKSALTEKYYGFLGELYSIAKENGSIDPMKIIDQRGGYRMMEGYGIQWSIRRDVFEWVQRLCGAYDIKHKYFGDTEVYLKEIV